MGVRMLFVFTVLPACKPTLPILHWHMGVLVSEWFLFSKYSKIHGPQADTETPFFGKPMSQHVFNNQNDAEKAAEKLHMTGYRLIKHHQKS